MPEAWDRDFGGTVRRTPREVARPASAGEVAALLRREPAAVTRGCGHSTGGQSLTSGIALGMRGLAAVHGVHGDRVSVGAGATWREVLAATLPHGLTPPVLTDYLDLTVGGTLSAGGVGGTSHVHGTQAGNALDLDVATADGEIVRCSPTRHRRLYDAVRGGMGRHGVITRATLGLVPAPRQVLSCKVACASAAELLRLQARTEADHLSGQAKPSESGGWRYELKAVLYEGEAPPASLPAPEEIETLSYLDFADRMRPDVAELIALGEWDRPHPWAMAFLPAGPGAAAFIEGALAAMGPFELGLSGVVLIKALPDRVLFGLLRTASPGYATAEEMTAANRTFHARARAAGGTPYPDGH
jgi:hypothetical protein